MFIMALVAYGDSGDELTDSDAGADAREAGVAVESSVTTPTILSEAKKKTPVDVSEAIPQEDELEDIVKRRFTPDVLKPAPKVRGKVQISIPSLPMADSDSDEESSVPTKKLRTGKATSFLSSLPAPKHLVIKEPGRKLLPYSVTNRSRPQPANRLRRPVRPTVSTSEAADDKSDEEENSSSSSFFSLEADSRIQPAEVAPPLHELGVYTKTVKALSTEPSSLAGPWGAASSATEEAASPTEADGTEAWSEAAEPAWPPATVTSTDSGLGMTAEELTRLQGRRGRGREQMELVDVHADDGLDPSQVLKHMTEENTYQSHKKGDENLPSSQQRRKHQITYLAFQAKEREQELKNQWSQNRMTKKQTQSKYGF